MKRIWNSVGKSVKDATFQKKAVKYVEKLEQGSEKVLAPKVPTEEKRFQAAQFNEAAKEDLNKKHDHLIDNMNKVTVKSTDPPERWVSSKELPTRESEWLHRNDPVWEFGFYEPAPEKIPENKLTFREALEILRAKQEIIDEEQSAAAAKRRENASSYLSEHVAVKRVDDELITKMFEYFRPFERKDFQKVVNKHDLARLQDYLQGHSGDKLLVDGAKEHIQELLKKKLAKEEYDRLDDAEMKKFQEAVKQIRAEEHERLEGRLKNIKEMEAEYEEAVRAHIKTSNDKKE